MSEQSPRLNRADLVTGLVFLGFGLLYFYWSWDMPRLENRRIHPLTIPGLVPMILGATLALCGLLLTIRAVRLGALKPLAPDNDFRQVMVNIESLRLFCMLGLTLAYTLILVGWLPFWLATALFVFSTIVLFEAVLHEQPRPLARSLFWALVQAVIIGFLVTLVFERGFLVRLP